MPLKSADICDSSDWVEVCCAQFKSFGQRRSFGGTIRTVRCYEDVADLRELVQEPGQGCVLVIDGGGSLQRAILGDNMAAALIRNGWGGVIVNGAVRDASELNQLDFGVKALGTNPKRGESRGGASLDVPVSFGNVTFVPGRCLVADEDGVAVLPEGMTP